MEQSGLNCERKSGNPVERHVLATKVEELSKLCVELALDARSREFGEQGRMPDGIKTQKLEIYLERWP